MTARGVPAAAFPLRLVVVPVAAASVPTTGVNFALCATTLLGAVISPVTVRLVEMAIERAENASARKADPNVRARADDVAEHSSVGA